jgi:phenylpropionate dioxygenase-like ring-hydroxylating dioxygenase large terminal subunit
VQTVREVVVDLIEQKQLLMNVKPGAPMHELMRRFWLPIGLSSDLPESGGDPVRITAIGLDFVLFRDGDGRLGLLDETCIHRSVSLCMGRNEGDGLRCIYHGWKFAVDGSVTDTPNVSDPRLKNRVKQPAYSVKEAGGLIWAYFGPTDLEPPFPHYPFFDVPEENRYVALVMASANFTRVVEGLLDSSHTGILHQDALKASAPGGKGPHLALGKSARAGLARSFSKNLAPDIEAQETDFGMWYAALRDFVDESGAETRVARVTAWRFPTAIFTPGDNLMQLTLPVDNDRSHFFMVFWDTTQVISSGPVRDTIREYYGIDDEGLDRWGLGREFHDLPGRPSKANRWGQDRELVRKGISFTGIQRFIPEDFAVSASMGPVELNPIEHLVPADLAIARFRRRLVDNAQRAVRGDEVLGLDPHDPFRAAVITLSDGGDWRDRMRGNPVGTA